MATIIYNSYLCVDGNSDYTLENLRDGSKFMLVAEDIGFECDAISNCVSFKERLEDGRMKLPENVTGAVAIKLTVNSDDDADTVVTVLKEFTITVPKAESDESGAE